MLVSGLWSKQIPVVGKTPTEHGQNRQHTAIGHLGLFGNGAETWAFWRPVTTRNESLAGTKSGPYSGPYKLSGPIDLLDFRGTVTCPLEGVESFNVVMASWV